MKKVFISQPMRGRSNEEIKKERMEMLVKAEEELKEEIKEIESFFENAPHDAKPLWFLAKSLELLSTADCAVFAPGWEEARGCKIEHDCAVAYNIPVLYL